MSGIVRVVKRGFALRFTIIVCLFSALATNAAATDLTIAHFAGAWKGTAISESEISIHFQLTSRDIGVEVRPHDGGFTLTWNTVQRQKGDPSNPEERLKSTTLEFAAERPGVWRGADSADPLGSDGIYSWAFVRETTLVVNTLRILADGSHEMQIYRRSLSGTGMALEFTRIVDGEPVRSVKGRLIKVAN